MKEDFQKALMLVLQYEGGKVDNKNDPGGRTNQGVTQGTYDAYRKNHKLPTRDVFNMSVDERDAIYREQYWDVIKGDLLPPGISFVVFDGAVNSGPSRSVSWLQQAMGATYKGRVDGLVGARTLDALREIEDHDDVIAKICGIRLAYMKSLKTWKYFHKGWTKRVKNVLVNGQALARGSIGPAVEWGDTDQMRKRALVTDAKPNASTGIADGISGGGITVATIAQTVDGAKQTLLPLAGQSQFIDNALAALTIFGVVLVLGGLTWRMIATIRNRNKEELTRALS